MKRKVIESIEMKIKLNACAHTFIHARTHKHTQSHTCYTQREPSTRV